MHQEWWRDRPCEAQQPSLLWGKVLIPAKDYSLGDVVIVN